MTAETLWRCQVGSRPYLGNRTVDAKQCNSLAANREKENVVKSSAY